MNDTTHPTDRATIVFEHGPKPALRCSHCAGEVSDADPECPACESPLDWGASADALRRYAAFDL